MVARTGGSRGGRGRQSLVVFMLTEEWRELQNYLCAPSVVLHGGAGGVRVEDAVRVWTSSSFRGRRA